MIRLMDRLLRRVYGVYEFSDDPQCIFRLSLSEAPRDLELPDGVVPKGTPVLELHFWNEHFPPIPQEGPDMAWALRMGRIGVSSMRAVARELQRDPRLARVRAVGGVTVLLYPGQGQGSEDLLRRLGFSIFPHPNPLGKFGEFWERLYMYGVLWTFNAPTVRGKGLQRAHRSEVWMSRETLLRLHGGSGYLCKTVHFGSEQPV